MMMGIPQEADYLIVGGGLTGCALASRLASLSPNTSIILFEAGPSPSSHPHVTSPMAGFALQGSELDWAYSTVPNPNTGNRIMTLPAGRTLGGGSVLNYGGWARGDQSDYDEWARIVGDGRWGYEGLLPYLKRSERFREDEAHPTQHGTKGPIKITSVTASDPKRRYPLREPLQKAWQELDAQRTSSSAGNLAGLSEFLENWDEGMRQPSHLAYGLSGVDVRPNTLIHRVLFETSPGATPRATGVVLADGQEVAARKEVIISAGAFRTPQILQLSGIGPAALLARHSVPLIHASPSVGTNLFDHFAIFQTFKLRGPERGLALGHPSLTDPAFMKGLPIDWIYNEALPTKEFQQALTQDGDSADKHHLSNPRRSHVETIIMYMPLAAGIPLDGTHISTSVMLTLPTSRGEVTLASSSPNDAPSIDPNYFSTSVDQAALIHGVQRLLHCLSPQTSFGKDFIESEVPPPTSTSTSPLTAHSSKGEIEERIRSTGTPHCHAVGSCAMGVVVDAELRVNGVRGLRIVDASVFPRPVGGHPQATLYGIAERAAAMIAGEKDEYGG